VRGLAVLLGRTITSPESLRSFHRRFSAVGPQIRLVTIATACGVAVAGVVALWAPVILSLVAGAVVIALVCWTRAGGLARLTTSSEEAVRPVQAPSGTFTN
jgi:Flp pilus assembly protein TadB